MTYCPGMGILLSAPIHIEVICLTVFFLGACLPDVSCCNVGMLKYVIPWCTTIIYAACSILALSYEMPCNLPLDKLVTAPDKIFFCFCFFQMKRTGVISKFSMKKYVVVLISMASMR